MAEREVECTIGRYRFGGAPIVHGRRHGGQRGVDDASGRLMASLSLQTCTAHALDGRVDGLSPIVYSKPNTSAACPQSRERTDLSSSSPPDALSAHYHSSRCPGPAPSVASAHPSPAVHERGVRARDSHGHAAHMFGYCPSGLRRRRAALACSGRKAGRLRVVGGPGQRPRLLRAAGVSQSSLPTSCAHS